jgi:TolA-binding protein
MKIKSSRVKLSVVTAVSALALSSVAFGSSAFASDTATPTPTPTISSTSTSDSIDSETSAELDVQGLFGDDQELTDFLDSQLADVNAEVNANIQGDDSMDAQQGDDQLDALNSDDQQEQADFSTDINAATQAGEIDDAAELSADASIVASVTLPEVNAMVSDDAQAHALIVGALHN